MDLPEPDLAMCARSKYSRTNQSYGHETAMSVTTQQVSLQDEMSFGEIAHSWPAPQEEHDAPRSVLVMSEMVAMTQQNMCQCNKQMHQMNAYLSIKQDGRNAYKDMTICRGVYG